MAYIGSGLTRFNTADDLTVTDDAEIQGDLVVQGTADINGGTIDGVTIGGASAGAGTFTTITGSGDMNIDSGTLFVDVSENRVGIGTTSPAEELHVETTGGATAGIQLSTTGGVVDRDWKFIATSSAGSLFIQDATASANRVAIDSSGNVGIGTASPNGVLELNESSSVAATTKAQTGYPNLIIKDSSGSFADERGGAISFEGVYGALAKIAGVKANGASSGSFRDFGELRFYVHGDANEDNYAALLEAMRIDSSGNLQFNSGYGSVATAYGCRAWVNFNGTSTVAIRDSGNVSSITDNAVGSYNINFASNMPDDDYAVTGVTQVYTSLGTSSVDTNYSVNTVRVFTSNTSDSLVDNFYVMVAVVR